jgi:putative copper resistance protein D
VSPPDPGRRIGLLGGAALAVAALAALAAGVGPGRLTGLVAGTPELRVAADALGTLAAGLGLLPWLVRRAGPADIRTVRRAAARAAVPTGAAWAAVGLAELWWQGAALDGRSPFAVPLGVVLRLPADLPAGRALLVTVAAGVTVAVLGVLTRPDPADRPGGRATGRGLPLASPPDGAIAVAALFGLLASPVTGHATETALPTVAELAVAAHVTGAAFWVGGLAAVLGACGLLPAGRRGPVLATALPAFSPVAAACLAVTAVSGLLLGLLRLPAGHLLGALVGTGYGILILGKVACLAGLAGGGAVVRGRVLPALRAGGPVVLGWAAAELTLMSVTLGLAATLALIG